MYPDFDEGELGLGIGGNLSKVDISDYTLSFSSGDSVEGVENSNKTIVRSLEEMEMEKILYLMVQNQ